MKALRILMAWLVSRLGAANLFRAGTNYCCANKTSTGEFHFPFIKARRQPTVQILAYHRVNDDGDPFFPAIPVSFFEQQMEYIAEKYTVCTLDDVVRELPRGNVPKNAMVITFDDGYKDNYVYAFPILKRLKLPAIIFLATDPIDSRRCLWHDRVFSAFRETGVPVLENFCDGRDYPLGTVAQKCTALNTVVRFLWSLEDGAMTAEIDRLREKLGLVEEPDGDSLMLNWEEIREMSMHGIAFGSHTITHPILSKVPPERAKREVEESKKVIEANINLPVRHFAYPVGRREDLSMPAKTMLRNAGYESAVTSMFGSNSSEQDRFELRRATPWDQDIDSFALRLSYFKFLS